MTAIDWSFADSKLKLRCDDDILMHRLDLHAHGVGEVGHEPVADTLGNYTLPGVYGGPEYTSEIETRPAYRSMVDQTYFSYIAKGLEINLKLGPYKGRASNPDIVDLRDFSLRYDPNEFSRFSILRAMLGRAPISLSIEDVDPGQASWCGVLGGGVVLELGWKGPSGEKLGAGLIRVFRDSGKLIITSPLGKGIRERIKTEVLFSLQLYSLPLVQPRVGSWSNSGQLIDVVE